MTVPFATPARWQHSDKCLPTFIDRVLWHSIRLRNPNCGSNELKSRKIENKKKKLERQKVLATFYERFAQFPFLTTRLALHIADAEGGALN